VNKLRFAARTVKLNYILCAVRFMYNLCVGGVRRIRHSIASFPSNRSMHNKSCIIEMEVGSPTVADTVIA